MPKALVAPVVTVAGIPIALGQLNLAKVRIRHDLYDRRYKLYDSARALVASIVREGRCENGQVLTFLRETGDATFLLDKRAVAYFKQLETRAFRLAFLSRIIRNEAHPNRNAAIDEEAELLTWFTDQFNELIQQFKPFLRLGNAMM
jgi:hypothetical protein